MKSKTVTGVLAIILGIWGVHRLYLGQRLKGLLQLLFTLFLLYLSFELDAPIVMAAMLLAFIDAILFWVMPKEEFDRKFNRHVLSDPSYAYQPHYQTGFRRQRSHASRKNRFRAAGIAKYREYDIDGAIDDFVQSLRIRYHDTAVHFNLACCYSLVENIRKSLFHLNQAVQLGFKDFDKIHQHPALAYLRVSEAFEDFVDHQYQLPDEQEVAETLENADSGQLLEQIAGLGELKEKGILTEEEFSVQKRKLLH